MLFRSLYGKAYIADADVILEDFEDELNTHGVSCISAIYDGNPPFQSRGCISKAKNVAEILRCEWLLEKAKGEK